MNKNITRIRIALVSIGVVAASVLAAGTGSAQSANDARISVSNHDFSQTETAPPPNSYATTKITGWPHEVGVPQVWHKDMCKHPLGYQCADLENNKKISRAFATVENVPYTVCADFNANPTDAGRQRVMISADPAPNPNPAIVVDTGKTSIRDGGEWREVCYDFYAEDDQTLITFEGMTGRDGHSAGAAFTDVEFDQGRV